MAKTTTCGATKSDGNPCRAPAMIGSEFCFFHAPEKATARSAAQKAGGFAGRAHVLSPDTPDNPLRSVGDVVTVLGETINQVRRGELDPRVANAVGYLSGLLLKTLEQTELEERISELESVVVRQPIAPKLLAHDQEPVYQFVSPD